MSNSILTEEEVLEWKKTLLRWKRAIENDEIAKEKQGLKREVDSIASRLDNALALTEMEQEKLLFDMERLSQFIVSHNLEIPKAEQQLAEILEVVESTDPGHAIAGFEEVKEQLEELIPKLKKIDTMTKEEIQKVYEEFSSISSQLKEN
ncbi:MAG: hypothetical protein H7A37_08840 [Chlamydiales bacterium]|nr:hypothetical protein [Chlamydiia bacterium]MCP5508386.1 hypothetical protein [Chlamydiales bacterium]